MRRGGAALHCRSSRGFPRQRNPKNRVLVDRQSDAGEIEKVGPAKVPEIFAPTDLFCPGVCGSNIYGSPEESPRMVIRCGASLVSADLLHNTYVRRRILISISNDSGIVALG